MDVKYARVIPVPEHPGMYRVIFPNGTVTDMTNKSRAAAIAREFNSHVVQH